MDILTPKGQRTACDERVAAEIFRVCTGCSYVHTPKDKPAKVDAVIVSQVGQMVGVVETKCRYGLTRQQLRHGWNDEWLVTMEKLDEGREAARLLGVPLFGFLFLVEEARLLTKVIASPEGQYCCKLRVDQTETQATVNGGKATRANAFVDMSDAKEWTLTKESEHVG
jgi:hypothetical protein